MDAMSVVPKETRARYDPTFPAVSSAGSIVLILSDFCEMAPRASFGKT